MSKAGSFSPIQLLADLGKVSRDDSQLQIKILEVAEEFTRKDILENLQSGDFKWLSDELRQSEPNTGMKVEAMLGLIMAMTALGGATTQHVGIFMKDIEEGELARLRSLYQANLSVLYGNREVCQWMARNASYLDEASLKLAKCLCEQSVAKPYDLMQISLIC